MIREERQSRLLEYVNKRRYASYDELMRYLQVSKATVRRDINHLYEEKALELTRGGVMALGADHPSELAYQEKANENSEEKAAIAAAAVQLLQPGYRVMVDAGTTTRMFTSHLGDSMPLNIVTNDIMIAVDLSSFENVVTTVTGGVLRRHFYTLRSFAAEDMLNSMQADIAFIGVDSISPATGCMVTNLDEVRLKQCMIRAAHRVVVLCDHTKFLNNSLITFARIEEIDTVITSSGVAKATLEELRELGVEVITV